MGNAVQTSSRRKRDGHKEKVGREGRVAGESIERSPLRSRKGSYAESVVNVLEEVLLDGRRRKEGQHSFLSSRLSRLRDSITVTVREREREREGEGRGIGRDGIHASASPSSRPRWNYSTPCLPFVCPSTFPNFYYPLLAALCRTMSSHVLG